MHHALDFQIGPCIFQFILHAQRISAPVKRRPVKRGHGQGHAADVILSRLNRLPVDQRQGVIQEMGIDLCLQRPHFRLLLGDFPHIDLVNQRPDASEHLSKAPIEKPDLILRLALHRHLQISLLHLPHPFRQLLDPAADQGGGHKIGDDRHNHAQQRRQHDHNAHRAHCFPRDSLRLIQPDFPARGRRSFQYHQVGRILPLFLLPQEILIVQTVSVVFF